MKEVFSNLLLLAVFAVVFSGLSACSDTASSQRGPVDEHCSCGFAGSSGRHRNSRKEI